MLVAIGPRWLTATSHDGTRRLDDPNDFVRLEVEAAVQRDIPVIPIRPDPDFDNDVRRLMGALEEHTATNGDLVTACDTVDERLDRGPDEAEPTARSADTDSALRARRRRRTVVGISAVVVLAVVAAAVVAGSLAMTSDGGGQTVADGESSEQQTGEQPADGQQTDGLQDTTSLPVFLEAEDGDVTAPMIVGVHPQACSDRFVSSIASGGPDDEDGGTATVGFDIEESGTYVFWGRVGTGGLRLTSSDSLFVSIDGGSEDTWDFREVEGPTAGWEWDGISLRCGGDFADHRCDPWQVDLEPGRHTLTFRTREPLSQLDAVFVAEQGSGDQPPATC